MNVYLLVYHINVNCVSYFSL